MFINNGGCRVFRIIETILHIEPRYKLEFQTVYADVAHVKPY